MKATILLIAVCALGCDASMWLEPTGAGEYMESCEGHAEYHELFMECSAADTGLTAFGCAKHAAYAAGCANATPKETP